MEQELLIALKTKFPGTDAKVLSRIAAVLGKNATTGEQVKTATAGVTQDFIDIIKSYGDSRATDAQKTAIRNYESKYGLINGQKASDSYGSKKQEATGHNRKAILPDTKICNTVTITFCTATNNCQRHK